MLPKNYKTKLKCKSLQSLLDNIKYDIGGPAQKKQMPDIITFCTSDDYLGLSYLPSPIELYPSQRIVLKSFYRGSKGNENVILTDEEIELCKQWGLTNDDNGNLLEKYANNKTFRELVLVWGRRVGKDFLASIIALYEAARLLECEGGDPHAIYNISSANPITILTIATAKEQAEIAFKEIREKLLHSKYFADKFISEGIENDKIWLLTPKDKIDNKQFKEKNIPLKKGSIVIEVGHSNSDSLLGKGVFVLILDEVASYKTSGGSSSGERIYTAMTPALDTYLRVVPVLDKNNNPIIDNDGKPKVDRIYDSKIVSISSPRGKEGIFWKLFSQAADVATRLVCRLPTWLGNPNQTQQSLRINNSSMTEEEFLMEFGAEFSGTAGENFFSRDFVMGCFDRGLKLLDQGQPGKVYFAHLDPARTSHNYALVMVHKEVFVNPETQKSDYFVVVDHIIYWHPLPGKPVQIEDVNNYVVSLRRRFHISLVTFDQWESEDSIKFLRKNGIPSKCTPYVKQYKMTIYDNLYNLVISKRLKIPHHQLLRDEMINLQRKYGHNGYKVYPMTEGDVRTDDIVDSLAGACYDIFQASIHQLPTGKLVNMGVVPSNNNMLWRGMQGPIGYGSGREVARRLESRQPWPFKIPGKDRFV